jgi:hypothetical protein
MLEPVLLSACMRLRSEGLGMRSDDWLWQWLLRKVYWYFGVMVICRLSMVLLGVVDC